MKTILALASAAFLICACASTSMNNGRIRQTKYMQGGYMSWEYVEKEPNVFELFALGAGVHSAQQVDAAFASKATELCGGRQFDQESELTKTNLALNAAPGVVTTSTNLTRHGILRCK